MKKWMAIIGMIACLATPTLAQAQQTVRFSAVEIDIMPEYDRPDVLIMYHLFLAPDVDLPVELTLKIPAAVGNPYNVAMRGDDGRLYNLTYDQNPAGDWTAVTFTTPSNEVRFEYYDPNLAKNGPERTYTYQWPGDYAIDALSILAQEPVDASDMRITPDLGEGTPGQSNLLQYNAAVGSLQAGEVFDVNLNYSKSSDRLTSSTLKVQTAGSISENTPGRRTINDVLPWALGIVALGMIGGGGYWYWQSSKAREQKPRPRRHAPREAEAEDEVESGSQIYCHRCGKRASPGDTFCRTCGTKLRS